MTKTGFDDMIKKRLCWTNRSTFHLFTSSFDFCDAQPDFDWETQSILGLIKPCLERGLHATGFD